MKNKKLKGRVLDGLILLDKPINITSNGILQEVKHLFQARKAGHTGSLDPIATGLLPICFGKVTKFARFLLEADKKYHVAAKLGVLTTTGDTEGEILEENEVKPFTENELNDILQSFMGVSNQVPPMYSAIKHQGKPLYYYARKGIEIERPARKIEIFNIELKNIHEDIIEFEVHCTKGTYVRTLVEDISKKLGCGGHVAALRRLEVGGFKQHEQVSYPQLQETLEKEGLYALDKYILPVEELLKNLPALAISEAVSLFAKQGKAIRAPSAIQSQYVKIMLNNRLFGVGEVYQEDNLQMVKLIKQNTN